MHNILCEPMSDGNVEPVRLLPFYASRGSHAARGWAVAGEWSGVDRLGGRAMLALSLSLTRVASVVSQMVQDEATNGRDAVRGRRPARRVALVVCAAVVWWSRDVHRLPLRSGN